MTANSTIQIGTECTCKVGRNQVRVTVTAGSQEDGWTVRTAAGKTMAIRDAARLQPVAAPATAPRGMSLVAAAVELLGEAGAPMGTKELADLARERGLWSPSRGGRTPDRTLYAAILREINTKGEASRFRKADRGRFALNV